MAVELVREEQVERDVLQFPPPPQPLPLGGEELLAMLRAQQAPEPPPKPPIDEQVLQVMALLAKALAVRAMLLLAMVGAFVIALIAMQSPSTWTLAILGMWLLGAVAPLIWLAQRKV